MAASVSLADLRYGISPNAILDSAGKYLVASDIGIMCLKSLVGRCGFQVVDRDKICVESAYGFSA